jgi:hypothetical protein
MKSARKTRSKKVRHTRVSLVKSAPQETTPTSVWISEEGKQALAEYGRGASHELANCLGTVVGELDFGLTSSDPLVRYRAMTVALAAAEKALTLARNLSYFATHSKLDIRRSDLSQLLLDTVELVEKDYKNRRIKVSVLVEASCHLPVDPGAIQQVLLNLFSRAAETMPQGGKLTVTLKQSSDHVEILCSDTGVGIASIAKGSPFNDQQDSRPLSSSLSVAKSLVEAHGGELHIRSEFGAGTVYGVILPYEPQDEKGSRYVEARRCRRIESALPVEVSFAGQSPFLSELKSLSVRGCFIAVPNAHLAKLPDENKMGSLRIYYYQDQVLDIVRCRIASRSVHGGQTGLGVEFLDYDAKTRKLLTAIVKSHAF